MTDSRSSLDIALRVVKWTSTVVWIVETISSVRRFVNGEDWAYGLVAWISICAMLLAGWALSARSRPTHPTGGV